MHYLTKTMFIILERSSEYFSWKDLNENCKMYVVANETYWECWRKKTDFANYLDLMASVDITCLYGKDVDFIIQKDHSANGSYTPHLPYDDFYKIST